MLALLSRGTNWFMAASSIGGSSYSISMPRGEILVNLQQALIIVCDFFFFLIKDRNFFTNILLYHTFCLDNLIITYNQMISANKVFSSSNIIGVMTEIQIFLQKFLQNVDVVSSK